MAVLEPQNSDLSVRQTLEKYLPTFSFGFAKRKSSNASYSWLESANMTLSKFNNYSAQVTETIPLGGTVTLGLTSAMTNTNQTGTTINPRYNSQLQFSFSQPLLRNFGVQMTQRDIVVARNNLDVSEIQFAQTVQNTIYQVIEAYWNLVYSVENLKVQQKSLDLAKDFLAKNERSVEIGTLAPIDVLAAQSEVATREANILSAEAAVKAGEDEMKNLLNFTPEEENGLQDVVALDSPRFEERKIEVDEALQVAMDKRPDLRISRINLKTGDLNLRYAKNQLLPSLSLNASYASPGVSGTQLIYDSDYFGNVIGTIPGYWSDSWNDVFGFKYENWNIALTLEFNLNTVVSRAAYGQAQLAMQTAALNVKNCGADRRPGNPQRRPDPPDGLPAGPGLQGRPRPGGEKAGRRGGKAPRRTEHELHGPSIPARHDDRPGSGIKGDHRLQRRPGRPGPVDGDAPGNQERQDRRPARRRIEIRACSGGRIPPERRP